MTEGPGFIHSELVQNTKRNYFCCKNIMFSFIVATLDLRPHVEHNDSDRHLQLMYYLVSITEVSVITVATSYFAPVIKLHSRYKLCQCVYVNSAILS